MSTIARHAGQLGLHNSSKSVPAAAQFCLTTADEIANLKVSSFICALLAHILLCHDRVDIGFVALFALFFLDEAFFSGSFLGTIPEPFHLPCDQEIVAGVDCGY